MAEPGHSWLEFACISLSCSPRFREVLDEQLAEKATLLTGVDLRGGFVIVPVDMPPVRYDEYRVAHMDADLVPPDIMAHPVRIAWKCEAHPGERITPDDSLPPTRGCRIDAWWEILPIHELRASYAQPIEPPFPIDTDYSFEIEWWPFALPDVWMEIQTRHPASERQIEEWTAAIEQARAEWNRKREAHGTIHNWSGLRHLGSNRYEMHVDFGSADQSVVSYWLRAIEEGCEALPERVVVRGYPIGG